jgi:hypothetical protein
VSNSLEYQIGTKRLARLESQDCDEFTKMVELAGDRGYSVMSMAEKREKGRMTYYAHVMRR